MLKGHTWLPTMHAPNKPIPMNPDPAYLRSLETAIAPTTKDEAIKLQKQKQFNYRQVIGELLYAMVTCCPDIAYPVITNSANMPPTQPTSIMTLSETYFFTFNTLWTTESTTGDTH